MMNAAIDFGNTRIKIGFFENEKLIEIFRTSNFEDVKNILIEKNIEKCIIVSVTFSENEINEKLNFVKNLYFFNQKTPLPIKNNYATPETLGLDRLAASVGANALFPSENCLVIDLGTAIKYDFVAANGSFEGGIISPGRKMRFMALNTFTKKLPLLDTTDVPNLIGNSTESCMASGVMNGIVAELNGIIEEYLKNLKIRIIICGGDAPHFETKIKYPTFAAPNLVLEGLNRILQYNVTEI